MILFQHIRLLSQCTCAVRRSTCRIRGKGHPSRCPASHRRRPAWVRCRWKIVSLEVGVWGWKIGRNHRGPGLASKGNEDRFHVVSMEKLERLSSGMDRRIVVVEEPPAISKMGPFPIDCVSKICKYFHVSCSSNSRSSRNQYADTQPPVHQRKTAKTFPARFEARGLTGVGSDAFVHALDCCLVSGS